jgi:hypothetical protein
MKAISMLIFLKNSFQKPALCLCESQTPHRMLTNYKSNIHLLQHK